MRVSLVAELLWLVALLFESVAYGQVHTALSDARTCVPLEGGVTAVATGGGLVTVDALGAPLSVLTRADGLPGTRVHSLMQGGDALWVGTERGLAAVRGLPGSPMVTLAMPSLPVRAVQRHGDGLLVATWGEGLLRLEDGRDVPSRIPTAPGAGTPAHQRLTALASWRGVVVVATAGAGLAQLVDGSLQPLEARLPSPVVWAIHPMGDGLLVGTSRGLTLLADGRSRTLSTKDVRSLAPTPRGILVGTFGEGLWLLDGRGVLTPEGGATELPYVQGVGGGEAGACLAARGGFALRPRRGTWRAATLPSLPTGDITSVAHHAGTLWAGTFDRGLWRLAEGAWLPVGAEVLDPHVQALAPAVDNRRLWVGSARGLCWVRGEELGCLGEDDGLPSAEVHGLFALPEGGVLVGTVGGAVVVEDGRVAPLVAKDAAPIRGVWAVAQDEKGTRWLGTTSGLYRVDPQGHGHLYDTASGHLPQDWVTAIVPIPGGLYVGTYSQGVTRLRQQADGHLASTRLGGAFINPSGLTVVGETLYASTMAGLFVRPVAGDGDWWVAAGAAPGMDVTAVLDTPDGLVVASRRGLATNRSREGLAGRRPGSGPTAP